MASRIETFLNDIMKAVYGSQVRKSIHDAIAECYDDVTKAKTLADTAAGAANTATTNANNAASAANTAKQNADNATSAVNTAISNTNKAIEAANTAKKGCDDAVAALPTTVTNMFSNLGLVAINGKLCVGVERE